MSEPLLSVLIPCGAAAASQPSGCSTTFRAGAARAADLLLADRSPRKPSGKPRPGSRRVMSATDSLKR